jgi:hypothetical protein
MNARIVWLCLFLLSPSVASAATCSAIHSAERMARLELRHAATEDDLVRAKHFARKAERALDQASKEAADCDCRQAQRDFRRSALYARHAKIAKDQPQFAAELQRAVHAFAVARHAQARCPH